MARKKSPFHPNNIEECPNCLIMGGVATEFADNSDLPERMREWCNECTAMYRREQSMRSR